MRAVRLAAYAKKYSSLNLRSLTIISSCYIQASHLARMAVPQGNEYAMKFPLSESRIIRITQ